MTRKYRPSNGSEGMSFESRFCAQCIHMRDDGRDPCPILGRVLVFDLVHPDYPAEWTYDAEGRPTCTAFRHDDGTDQPEPYRCPETKDMFG